MDAAAFDFTLGRDAIALRPIRPPERGRMMIIDDSGMRHHRVRDLPRLLNPGDRIIVNDTRVIAAALSGTLSGRPVDITLLPPPRSGARGIMCDALARPARRFAAPARIDFPGSIRARVIARRGPRVTILFPHGDIDAWHRYLEEFGQVPLPPYIRRQRPASTGDIDDYQTPFAARAGSIAAPTAGLHFTPFLLRRLRKRRISVSRLTLHVGPGTFVPVRHADVREHVMQSETFAIPFSTVAAIRRTRRRGGRIIAVGTTVCRTLESVTAPYGRLYPRSGSTSLFILPGWQWRAVDGLLTNFHLPRSTPFLLTCAFGGTAALHRAYARARDSGYRFYSYGDCCLLLGSPRRPSGQRWRR